MSNGATRVALVVQNLPVPRDRRVWNEARALREAGYEVHVVCPSGDDEPGRTDLEGVHLHRYPTPPVGEGQLGHVAETAWAMAHTARELWRIARGPGLDAVQFCNPPDTYVALGLPVRATGRRVVFDHHDLTPELYVSRFRRPHELVRRLLLLLERASLRGADAVVTTNDSMRRIAVERGGVAPDRVTVVRNGPIASTMRAGRACTELLRGRSHLACFVGSMGPQDGVELLVDAIRCYVHDLGRDDCTFALLGDGPSLSTVHELVDAYGLEGHVTTPGWVGDDDLARYLSTAVVGLCPEQPSPANDRSTMIKTAEYLAFGLPVVAFDLAETRVTAADAAVYVDEVSATAYAQAIARLIDDGSLREQMSVIGRRRAELVLSWEGQAPAYVSVYRSLTGAVPA